MAGTTNDDDLLILSDDTDSGTDFVLDDTIISENKNSSNGENLISFDTDLSNFGNNEDKVEFKTESDNSFDGFSLDFSGSNNTDNTKENEIVEKVNQDNENNNDNFGFGLMEDTNEETVEIDNNDNIESEKKEIPVDDKLVFGTTSLSNNDSNNVGTMTDILDEAIAKFLKREDVIASNITSKEEHIRLLKEQITSLESAVNTDNEEVVRLNTEKQSIVKNRKSLEKMKEPPVITK